MACIGARAQDMVTWLSMDMGWEEMARKTGVKVFASNPSVKSSLKVKALFTLKMSCDGCP